MDAFTNSSVQLLTIKDAAKRLAISTRTIHREISAGRFPRPVKIGRSSRVPVPALEAYVRSLLVQPSSK